MLWNFSFRGSVNLNSHLCSHLREAFTNLVSISSMFLVPRHLKTTLKIHFTFSPPFLVNFTGLVLYGRKNFYLTSRNNNLRLFTLNFFFDQGGIVCFIFHLVWGWDWVISWSQKRTSCQCSLVASFLLWQHPQHVAVLENICSSVYKRCFLISKTSCLQFSDTCSYRRTFQ